MKNDRFFLILKTFTVLLALSALSYTLGARLVLLLGDGSVLRTLERAFFMLPV